MQRQITTDQRKVRELKLKITGTGTAAINVGSFSATLVDNGAGDYTITYNEAFSRILGVQATAGTAGLFVAVVPTATAVQVLVYDDAGVATDGIVYLNISGSDDSDEY